MPLTGERPAGAAGGLGTSDEALQILVFTFGGARVGLPVRQVVGLLRMVEIVELPGAPPFVEGLFNYHGEILPVLNMRFRFRAEPIPIRASQMLVVARRDGRNCAFRVDHVEGIRAVDPALVCDTDRLSPAVDAITGVVALEDGLVLIYGLETFLSAAEDEEMKSFLASVPDSL